MIERHALTAPGSTPISFREDDGTQKNLHLELALDVARLDTGPKTALYLHCCQDAVQPVDKQDAGELSASLCLDKVGQSPEVLTPQDNLSGSSGPGT